MRGYIGRGYIRIYEIEERLFRDRERVRDEVRDGLGAFASDTARQLNILGHDGHTLGVDGAQIGVLEQTDQVGLGRFLQSSDGGRLESKIGLEILGDFTNKSLEGELTDQKLRRLLVSPDFSESDGSGTVTVRFLDTSRGGGALTRGLGGQLLAGRLASGRLSGGLLGTCHGSTR